MVRIDRIGVTLGARCVASLLAVMVALAVPSVWGSDAWAEASGSNLTVNLNFNQKTDVNDTSYKLGNATVTGGPGIYAVVEVDNGWFTSNGLPTGLQSLREINSLNTNGDFAVTVESGQRYRYVSFGSTNGGDSISAQSLQDFLRALTFHMENGGSQTVSVSTVGTRLDVMKTNGEKHTSAKKAVLVNGHAYTFITERDPDATFEKAYMEAGDVSFDNVNGRLMTIESQSEDTAVHKLLDGDGGWIGGMRTAAPTNGNTAPTCGGEDWYWVTGESQGKKFWSRGSGAGMYTNWNKPPTSEACYVQYGLTSESGAWNALGNTAHQLNVKGYYVEFDQLGSGVKRVTGTTKTAAVRFNLLDVTSTNMQSRVLHGSTYETTLKPNDGRQLDAASLKVTVGGKSLKRGGEDSERFTFNGGNGHLRIPAGNVDGDVVITAYAKRFVDLQERWTSETLVRLQVEYGGILDVTLLDNRVGVKGGYKLVGYEMTDGAKWDFSTPVTKDLVLRPIWELYPPVVSVLPISPRLERANATVMLHASSQVDMVPNATFTYQWSKDGEQLNDGANGVLAVREPGTYLVRVTATDPATGLTSQAETSVKVLGPRQHTVTLQGKGGFSSLKQQFPVTNGDKLSKNNLDMRAAQKGYMVVGYTKTDGSQWPFDAEVLGNLTLYPQYKMIAPMVTATAEPTKLTSVGDKSTLTAQATSQVDGAVFTYQWLKGGKPIKGATGKSHRTGEPGDYTVEVTVMDPRTNMSAKGMASVTLAAPDKHKVTVAERDGSKVYMTLEVPNGGLLDVLALITITRDGQAPIGWTKADGSKFDPVKDRITSPLTISPEWKPVKMDVKPTKPAKPTEPTKPAKPTKPAARAPLADTGLAVAAPTAALVLLLSVAGTLAVLRRRHDR
ncbi:hypothetical protein [Bifidobacterium panos]|uniref:C-type lectin domain-containing protein n=1 Tax=Bifidobacterium panos TaxID=2675321 RepID=A0ABX1SXC3_9BIFI|nr:hypothetical protein [Bifidobacterium sp. DSM 109963]NMN01543.1 hypothetical protein [Bifidobacterium sp. DSM 109963]